MTRVSTCASRVCRPSRALSVQVDSSLATSVRRVVESLESRRLLCMDHLIPVAENPKNFPQVVIDTPEEIQHFLDTMVTESPTQPTTQMMPSGSPTLTGRGESSNPTLNISTPVAPITWVNRGITSGADDDRFDDVFGASAGTARAVMDAAINMWARVIGSFNYAFPLGGSTFQLTVKMATGSSGNGASASAGSFFFGKPMSGAITMGSGGNGLGSGWFIDSTPYEHSEFLGNIDNAFAGQAQSGSAALGKGDFLTVAIAEIAHCMGLYFAPSAFQNNVTNTGRDDAAVGGTSVLYSHDTTNIDHLMTEFDSGGGDTNQAVHTAEPQTMLNYSGRDWSGTDDAGNAYYSFSQRCLVPENLRLIFNDSLGYSTVAASTYGSMHAFLSSSGQVVVRGSGGVDVIYVYTDGTDLVVDVDPQADVPGSGSLSSAGNVAAWRSYFPLASVSSISVNGGGGTDYVRLERNGGKSITLNGGDGDDFIDFSFGNQNLDNQPSGSSIYVQGGAGNDGVYIYDNLNTIGDTFTITGSRFDRPFWGGFAYAADLESLSLTTGTGSNTVNIPSTYPGQPIWLNSVGTATSPATFTDTINIGDAAAGVGMQNIRADITIDNNPSYSVINMLNGSDTVTRTATINFASGNYEQAIGLAPAVVYFDRVDTREVNVTMGSAADTLRVYRNSETLNIHNSGNGDTVLLGDNRFIFGNGLNDMTGDITIDNTPSYTTILVDDYYGGAARSATWTNDGTYTIMNGLQPAGIIRYKNADTNSVNVLGGGFNDTFTLNDFTRATTINGGNGNDTMTVNGIASGWPLTLNGEGGDDLLDINETTVVPVTVNSGTGVDYLNVNDDSAGTALAVVTANEDVRFLNLGAGGRISLTPGRNKAFMMDNGFVSGVMDLADNALIQTNVVGTPNESFFRDRLVSGRNGGAWNGAQPAFVSSTAAASALSDALGYGINGQNGVSFASLYGLPVAVNDLVIRYALNGDGNLDGVVNFDDLLVVAQNYGTGGARWSRGDFDYNGPINFDDLLVIAQQYGTTLMTDFAAARAQVKSSGVVTRVERTRRDNLFGNSADDALRSII